MSNIKIFGLACLIFIGLLALSLGLGYFNVFATKTVGKAQQNANREVFEQTQSYVEGKRQELIKYHHEWVKASKEDKESIQASIRLSFANFDDELIKDPDLYSFLKMVKNN